MYKFDKDSPLYLQLYEQIKYEIINNLNAGEKLASIREVSNTYRLSKTTVYNAYKQLLCEGYIESIEKSGFYVCEDIYKEINTKVEKINYKKENSICYKIDFFPASLDKNSFPKILWLKLYNKVLKNEIDFGTYANLKGDYDLREELRKYLLKHRAVSCSNEQIIITNGFSNSISLLSNILKKISNTVAMESPCFKVAKKSFTLSTFNILDIPVNKDGLDVEKLENSKAKILYITPSHQFPTGVTMPISNRLRVISWAKKSNSYIIEDDYDSELSYYNRPIPSMQSLENSDRVIYLGTFSKALSPALRVSYIVLPNSLLDSYNEIYDFIFSNVSLDIQKTLALFMKEGHWEKHLRRVRNSNRKKHNLMKEYLNKYLKNEIKILREGSGLNLLIKATKNIDYEKLERVALNKGVKIYFKEFFNLEKVIALGFGGFLENEIENAIKTFSDIWFEAKIL